MEKEDPMIMNWTRKLPKWGRMVPELNMGWGTCEGYLGTLHHL